jgi:hypothetical protein
MATATAREQVVRGLARLIAREIHPDIIHRPDNDGTLDVAGPAALRIRRLYEERHKTRVRAVEWRQGLKAVREAVIGANAPARGPKPTVTTGIVKARTRAIRFDDAHWDLIVAQAERTDIPASEWVRRAARHALACTLAEGCHGPDVDTGKDN